MAQVSVRLRLNFPPDSFFPALSFFPEMFFISETDCGHTFYAETFSTFDEACDFLNMLQLSQEDYYSYARDCAIAELSSQLVDFMAENQES